MLTAVYDVRQDASEGLEGVPAVAPTAAEVARQCDVVLIAVVNAQQTIDVLNGPDGVLSQARPDLTIVLLATVPLQDLKQIRELTDAAGVALVDRSEEHTSELQSLMRSSYAVFCLKTKHKHKCT